MLVCVYTIEPCLFVVLCTLLYYYKVVVGCFFFSMQCLSVTLDVVSIKYLLSIFQIKLLFVNMLSIQPLSDFQPEII